MNNAWVQACGCKRRYPNSQTRTCSQKCGYHLIHYDFKCLCVCVYNRSGKLRGRTEVVTCNFRTYYTLYCVCVITSGRLQGEAAEADTIREQQLKQTQSGCSLAWPCETSARQRHYSTMLLVRQSRGLCQTHTDVVKEVWPQKHNYVCFKERTVMHRAVLTRTEVRAPPFSAPWRAEGARLLT